MHANWIDQLGGRVRRSALVAAIAVLILRLAARARSFDKAIGQKRAGLRVEKLRHVALDHQARVAQGFPEHRAQFAVLRTVGAAVIVELDVEPGEVADVVLAHVGDQRLFAAAFLAGPNHDRRAVRVVGADIDAAMPAQLLETHPDVRLDVLDQMADVDMAIGVGERGGNQNTARRHANLRSSSRDQCGILPGKARGREAAVCNYSTGFAEDFTAESTEDTERVDSV